MAVRVTGLDETTTALRRFAGEIEDDQTALGEIAGEAARLVSSFVPRRSGRLAGSVRPGTSPGRSFVQVGTPYAYRARPAFPRADAQLLQRAPQIIDQALDRAAREAGLTVG